MTFNIKKSLIVFFFERHVLGNSFKTFFEKIFQIENTLKHNLRKI